MKLRWVCQNNLGSAHDVERISSAGYGALIIKKNAIGTIVDSSHGKFAGWYVVEFPIINCFAMECDISEECLCKPT